MILAVTNTPFTLADAAERLGVSARRVRALVERGQLPATQLGRVWLTTPVAVDYYKRNSPGRGRPLSPATAWRQISELAEGGTLEGLGEARRALRARARHGVYAVPALVARRLGTPAGGMRGGLDAVEARSEGAPIDLYVPEAGAKQLLAQVEAAPAADGELFLHVVDPKIRADELTIRERLVVAWCDLADRADPAAELVAERLWPGSIRVERLADISFDGEQIPYTALRGFTDSVARHPHFAVETIADPPPATRAAWMDSLFAAIAEAVADDADAPRPAWTSQVPPASHDQLQADHPLSRNEVPAAFRDRGIDLPRETFWRQR